MHAKDICTRQLSCSKGSLSKVLCVCLSVTFGNILRQTSGPNPVHSKGGKGGYSAINTYRVSCSLILKVYCYKFTAVCIQRPLCIQHAFLDALRMTLYFTSCHDKYSYTYQHDETYQVDDKVSQD